ncbi:MAG TPA: tetratricopeptide repeat protein [Planctomycetota bacterium]|nr:tetratricopeptide repeat protein [Planctomycetota bacterium]
MQASRASEVSPERKAKAEEARRAGAAAVERGDLLGGIASFEESIALDPADPAGYHGLASAQYRAKRTNAAEKSALQGRKIAPDYVGFYVLLGRLYDDRRLPDKAIAEYVEGLRRHPDDAELRLQLGITFSNKGNAKKAIEEWDRGVRSAPAFAPFHLHLAKAWSKTEERFPVFLHAEQFLNLEPDGPRAEEMSALLFKTLRDAVSRTGKGSVDVRFTKEVVLTVADLRKLERGEMGGIPIGLLFEFTYGLELAKRFEEGGGKYSLASEVAARRAFLKTWFEDWKAQRTPDVPLFARWREIERKGHLEAYVHRLLRAGSPGEWEAWKKGHAEPLAAYLDWQKEHPFRPGTKPRSPEREPRR